MSFEKAMDNALSTNFPNVPQAPTDARPLSQEDLALMKAEIDDRATGPVFDPTEPTEPTEPAPEPTPASRSRLLLPAIVAAAFLLGAAGVGYTMNRAPSKATVTGTFTLLDSDYKYNSIGGSSSSCYGEDGYSDIGPGTQVVAKDGDGKLLASSRFGSGTGQSTSGITYACTFSFTLEVPTGEDFYAISVGSSDGDGRGQMSYSAEELEERDWTVGLTMGD